jgi:copper transport protein
MPRSSSLLIAAVLPLLATAAFAEAALGGPVHERLVRSSPGRGDTLAAPPRELRLTFSSRVELAFSGLELLGPDGRPVALGPLSSPPDSSRVLVTSVVGAMAPGRYTVAWRTGGADGHPVRGSYEFVVYGTAVAAPADSTAASSSDTAAATHTHDLSHGEDSLTVTGEAASPASDPLQVMVRWVTFVAMLGVLGVAFFQRRVLRREPAGAAASLAEALERRARSLGVLLAALLLAAVFARLAAQWDALGGSGADASLGRVLTTTEWGWGWMLQLAGTLLALAGFVVARRSRAGWSLVLAALLPLAVAPALSGHAAATGELAPLTILADAAHVLAAGAWIGTLLVLVLAGLPAALARPSVERGPAAARLVERFSPLALAAAGVLVASGVVSAWVQLGSIDALFASAYGQALLWKLIFLALVAAVGAFHWRRARPALGSEQSARRLRRTAGVELALAMLVLLITAVLVATPPPVQ